MYMYMYTRRAKMGSDRNAAVAMFRICCLAIMHASTGVGRNPNCCESGGRGDDLYRKIASAARKMADANAVLRLYADIYRPNRS